LKQYLVHSVEENLTRKRKKTWSSIMNKKTLSWSTKTKENNIKRGL